MRKKFAFLISIALLGFLALKPPAIGSEKGQVIVTPEVTVTPSTKPHLRDFDDEGDGPKHFEDHLDHPGLTPEAKITASPKPQLLNPDDDEDELEQFDGHRDRHGFRNDGDNHHGHEHDHEHDLDQDSNYEDD